MTATASAARAVAIRIAMSSPSISTLVMRNVPQNVHKAAAVAIAALEGSRLNEFAYWRRVEAKVVETLPRPATEAPAQVPSENRVEAQ